MESNPILERLSSLADAGYAGFQAKLVPNIPPESVLGVRIPDLRRLARELRGTTEASNFMSTMPHRYYDENCLHGLLINELRGYDETVAALDAFLPYVDNWAVCDIISPRAFKKRPEGLYAQARRWMADGAEYTVRFGIGVLMSFYLDDGFDPQQPGEVAACCCDKYYVNMMAAWYFATALAKQPEAALPYIEQRRLSQWVHNKAIQKAVESRRISAETKEYLKSLRWK